MKRFKCPRLIWKSKYAPNIVSQKWHFLSVELTRTYKSQKCVNCGASDSIVVDNRGKPVFCSFRSIYRISAAGVSILPRRNNAGYFLWLLSGHRANWFLANKRQGYFPESLTPLLSVRLSFQNKNTAGLFQPCSPPKANNRCLDSYSSRLSQPKHRLW